MDDRELYELALRLLEQAEAEFMQALQGEDHHESSDAVTGAGNK